ncbi:MAG: hypothetical protein AAB425_09570, partial [Bdellovibrionota bacterium]
FQPLRRAQTSTAQVQNTSHKRQHRDFTPGYNDNRLSYYFAQVLSRVRFFLQITGITKFFELLTRRASKIIPPESGFW